MKLLSYPVLLFSILVFLSGCSSGSDSNEQLMNENDELFTLSIEISGDGTVDHPAEYSYQKDTQVILRAEPDDGNIFSRWESDISSTASTLTVTMTRDMHVRAVFSSSSGNSSFIIDHSTCRLSAIPSSWISQAKSSLHIGYQHTSHGSQITTGMSGLASWKGSLYAFNEGGSNGVLDLRDYDLVDYAYSSGTVRADDLGNPNWYENTRNYLRAKPVINVIMWAWCGQVSGASESDINTYLSRMTLLEQEFPGVKFVYMTGHVDGTGPNGNLHRRNEQIRAYCRTNGKILYDFADIESYDPNGNGYMNRLVLDSCYYDANNDNNPWNDTANWAIDWQNSHVLNVDWYQCESAHSQPLNANLKAYAAWWMFARLAGWNGM